MFVVFVVITPELFLVTVKTVIIFSVVAWSSFYCVIYDDIPGARVTIIIEKMKAISSPAKYFFAEESFQ
jgi:hypothetical protein